MGDDEAEERLIRQIDQCEFYSIRWATISASVGFTNIRHSSVRQHPSCGWMLSDHLSMLIGRRGFDSNWQLLVGLVTLVWARALLSSNRGRLNKAAIRPPPSQHSRVAATNISPARKGWVRPPTSSSPLQGTPAKHLARRTSTHFTGKNQSLAITFRANLQGIKFLMTFLTSCPATPATSKPYSPG